MNIKTFTAHCLNISSKTLKPKTCQTVTEFLKENGIAEVFANCKSGFVFVLEDGSKVTVRSEQAIDFIKEKELA